MSLEIVPNRFIVMSSHGYLAAAHKDYLSTLSDDHRYNNSTWRITYEGSDLGYSIININLGYSLSQYYNTNGGPVTPPIQLNTINDKNFDILKDNV